MSTGEVAPGRSAGETSASLIARAVDQDADAWRRLVALYTPLIVHWSERRGLRGDDAADIVQEVLRAAVRSLHGFRKRRERDTFRGWLRRITENKIHDHFRRLRAEPQGAGGTAHGVELRGLMTPAESDEDAVSAERIARCQLLHRALAGLRDSFRENTWRAFWLTTVEGRAPKDVGPELEMSAGAVRVAKSRVLQRLREELGDRT